jgi:hypothetical protein
MKVRPVLLGVVAPILCLAFDGVVFKGTYPGIGRSSFGAILGDYRVFAYLVVGLCGALYVGQNWVKLLAPYAWLWAPSFVLIGAGALVVAIIVIPFALLTTLLCLGPISDLLRGRSVTPEYLLSLLQVVFYLFTSVVGLIAWAPALHYLRTGLRGMRGIFRSVRRVLAAVAFGLTVLGVPALLNGVAQDFVDRQVDTILQGTRAEAVASAQSLRAAFWCDWSCLHRLPMERRSWDALPEARRVIIADCFRIATGDDIERHIFPAGGLFGG